MAGPCDNERNSVSGMLWQWWDAKTEPWQVAQSSLKPEVPLKQLYGPEPTQTLEGHGDGWTPGNNEDKTTDCKVQKEEKAEVIRHQREEREGKWQMKVKCVRAERQCGSGEGREDVAWILGDFLMEVMCKQRWDWCISLLIIGLWSKITRQPVSSLLSHVLSDCCFGSSPTEIILQLSAAFVLQDNSSLLPYFVLFW